LKPTMPKPKNATAMDKQSKIYIAGHQGMVGSAIHRKLQAEGYKHFVFRTFKELDLCRQEDVERFFETEKPDYVFVAAAKVGGIVANNIYRAQFIYENLMIQNNIIHAAWQHGVKKLLFLGSSCIYPKDAPQPLKEEYLLTGLLEQTNEPYAIAKIVGIKMCENYYRQYGCDFISVMPTNLFGPNDNYDLEKSHVLPALIRKMHLAKCLEQNDWQALRADLDKRPVEGVSGGNSKDEILSILKKHGISMQEPTANSQQPIANSQQPVANNQTPTAKTQFPAVGIKLWGSGKVYREFLHVNDMAAACVHIMQHVDAERLYGELKQTHINIGTGIDLTIKELAELVKEVTGFSGTISWDTNKPDGTFKKQLDVSLLGSLDWRPGIGLKDGIRAVYEQYVENGR
jgi:GDP-L-fucose synthase